MLVGFPSSHKFLTVKLVTEGSEAEKKQTSKRKRLQALRVSAYTQFHSVCTDETERECLFGLQSLC